MSHSIFKLVYVSSASYPMSRDEIMSVLEISRKNNSERGITGLLLCYEDNFFQLLEGEEHEVKILYEKILGDPRHKGVLKLLSESSTSREFPNWSMGFKLVDGSWDDEFREGLNDVFKSGELDLNNVTLQSASKKVQKLLTSFKHISGMVVI